MVDRLRAVFKDARWLKKIYRHVYRDTSGHVFLFRALITRLLSLFHEEKINVHSGQSVARVIRQYISVTMTTTSSHLEDRRVLSGGMRSCLAEYKDVLKQVLIKGEIPAPPCVGAEGGVVDAHQSKHNEDARTLVRRGMLVYFRGFLEFPSPIHRRLAFCHLYPHGSCRRLNTESIDDFLVGALQCLSTDDLRREFSEGVRDVSEESATRFSHHVFAALSRCLPPTHCVVAEVARLLGTYNQATTGTY